MSSNTYSKTFKAVCNDINAYSGKCMNHVAPIAKKIVLPPSTSRPTVYSTKTVRKKLNDIPFRLSTLSLLVSLLFTNPVTAYADVTVTSSAEGGTAVHAPTSSTL